MKNIFLKIGGSGGRAKKGSALLITLLMMGVLMTLTLGISTLVIREIRVTQSIVDANKAYYAAEAGVEQALLELAKNKAGFEDAGVYPVVGAVADAFLTAYNPAFSYNYKISNKSDSVPSFPDDQPIFADKVQISLPSGSVTDCQLSSNSNPTALAYTKDQLYHYCPRATYRKLGLNETAIIPLFSTGSGGVTTSVNDFLVEYYLNLRDGNDLYMPFNGMDLKNFDVLRWKIYGQPKVDGEVQRTESIADFYPGMNGNGPDTPVCIGTDSSITAVKAIDGAIPEHCQLPSLSKRPPTAADLAGIKDLNDVTLWSAARECYQTDAGAAVTGGAMIKGTPNGDFTGCSMRDFIDNHKENYLILTNMVNPNVAGISNMNDSSQLSRADIYYRVIARKDAAGPRVRGSSVPMLVKDFAEISSQGLAANGAVAKTLDVRYKAPGFLPVFNFSLYKTSQDPNIRSQ